MSDMLEEFKKYLSDPKVIEEFSNKLKFKRKLEDKHMNKIKEMYNDQETFDNLVNKILDKHDEKWIDRCYKNGIMPHPWELLYTLFDIAKYDGVQIGSLDGLTENFPSVIYEYKDWQFAITHGQGSVSSVYYKNVLKYRN